MPRHPEHIPDQGYSLRGEKHISQWITQQVRGSWEPDQTLPPAYLEAIHELAMRFDNYVLHQDTDMLVVNKPAGIVVHAGRHHPIGVNEIVSGIHGRDAAAVHRLDKDTSGLLVLAKTDTARRRLSQQFERHQVKKTYIALVDGQLPERIGGIIAPLTQERYVTISLSEEAKPAATSFSPIASLVDSRGIPRTLLKVRIFTGRKHQIRAHLAELGFPIIGDHTYNTEDPNGFPRQLLHAFALEFTHPTTENSMTVYAPLAKDFREALARYSVQDASPLFDEVLRI